MRCSYWFSCSTRGELYIVNEKNDSESRGSKSISILDGLISGNTEKIPPSPVIKQLAVAVENGKKFSSMKDFLATNKGSSPIKERAGLSLFAVRSLVLCEKEDNISEFPDEVKLYSLISLLFDADICRGKVSQKKDQFWFRNHCCNIAERYSCSST
ncbi:hypothetical protein EUGRSUZ_I00588 [Eucalyptus grandis]|uniref:Uncharacterized protein n=2 Tax=Eucalyptus grandis TaxID=71139 RepID=A0ACC3JDE3_EUCGR|nr:hypothetical protein EUGRSUZ_I00588 [Eucalyptus grandis]